jgi:hypothetical protein
MKWKLDWYKTKFYFYLPPAVLLERIVDLLTVADIFHGLCVCGYHLREHPYYLYEVCGGDDYYPVLAIGEDDVAL